MIYVVETISILKKQYTSQFVSGGPFASRITRAIISDGDLDHASDQFDYFKSLPISHNSEYIGLYGFIRVVRICQYPMTVEDYRASKIIIHTPSTVLREEIVTQPSRYPHIITLKLKKEFDSKIYSTIASIEAGLMLNSRTINVTDNILESYGDFNPIPKVIPRGAVVQIQGTYPETKKNKKFWKIFGS